MTTPLEIGQVWLGVIEGIEETKERPCVITSPELGMIQVVYGGEKPHPNGKHYAVLSGSRAALQMGLTKTTHFWHRAVRWITRQDLVKPLGRCPLKEENEVLRIAFFSQIA